MARNTETEDSADESGQTTVLDLAQEVFPVIPDIALERLIGRGAMGGGVCRASGVS